MPHHRSTTSLLPMALDTSTACPSLRSLGSFRHSRKARGRATFFALFSLISISAYFVFLTQPTLQHVPVALRRNKATSQLLAIVGNEPQRSLSSINQEQKHGEMQPQVKLDQTQELAAVSSFLASLPQNVIPLSVDPAHPIDPQLVLDFDTRSPRAVEEIRYMIEDVWTRHPVILYSKLYSSISREVKAMLEDMRLSPPPTIFDVDQRDDADVLQPLLARLTTSTEFPLLLVGGKPIGSIAQIRELSKSGELKKMVTAAGAVIGGTKGRKGR